MNTTIIQKIYAAFKTKDLPSILELQAEDTEWSVAGPANKIPWAAPRYGHEGVTDFLRVLGGLLVPEVFEIKDFLENGGTVVATGYQKGYVRPTGIPYEFDFVHLWELQQGKVTKFRVYYDTYYVADVLSGRSGVRETSK
ncbi:MAG TPA: nuclear transport factor 2 family protein [Flavisolibacter sp.]|nr:nuclear transport factor 2 family protein [Flavisolibacter sp.]